jgi:hypothetical protein
VKATHNGHCQICGRLQASTPRLALHGYKVTWHEFRGTCSGSGKLPIELSTKLLDTECQNLTADAAWKASRTAENLDLVTFHVVRPGTKVWAKNRGAGYGWLYVHESLAFTDEAGYRQWQSDDRYQHYERAVLWAEYERAVLWAERVKTQVFTHHNHSKQMRMHVEFLSQLRAEFAGKPLAVRA